MATGKTLSVWRERNRERIRAYQKAWCAANPDKVKAYQHKHRPKHNVKRKAWRRRTGRDGREAHLIHRYGLTLADKTQMYADQGGRCAGCLREIPFDWRTCVDHDHVTGTVRGILCSECNMALGLMGDSSARLFLLAMYAQKFRRIR
jgi:hypothetical protein